MMTLHSVKHVKDVEEIRQNCADMTTNTVGTIVTIDE